MTQVEFEWQAICELAERAAEQPETISADEMEAIGRFWFLMHAPPSRLIH